MIIVTGGAFQGKLAFARTLMQELKAGAEEKLFIAEGGTAGEAELRRADILEGFHRYIRRLMQEGQEPFAAVQSLVQDNPGICLVVDQLGCGIVPVEPFDRSCREQVGRICCELAKEAGQVWLVNCGIGKRLK